MNSNLEPAKENTLLDAVLRDEEWQATSAVLKTGALAAFRQRQRRRRLTRTVASALVLCAALVAASHWRGRHGATSLQVASSRSAPPKEAGAIRYLTDGELLALFPKGSCVLAEIDGRKELVFLDPKVERIYLSKPGEAGR